MLQTARIYLALIKNSLVTVHPLPPWHVLWFLDHPDLETSFDHSAFILVDALCFYILHIFRDVPPPSHQ